MAYSNAAYGTVSVGSTATLIKAANNNRSSIRIANNGTATIYVGSDASVLSTTGIPIAANTEKVFQTGTALYGIAATAQDVRYFEEAL